MDRAEFVEYMTDRVFDILTKRANKHPQRFVAADTPKIVAWLGWTESPDFGAIRSALTMLENAGLIEKAKSKDDKGRVLRGFIVNRIAPAAPEPVEVAPTELVLTAADANFLQRCGIAIEEPEFAGAK
jgi:hypothetical protein